MSTPASALALPKRLSLSAQAAAAIRQGIAQRIWQDFLPGERQLCDLLKVSRPTIRAALDQLAREGLIEVRQGRRNRLLSRQRSPRLPRSRLVVLVTQQLLSQTSYTVYQGISEMRAHLAEHGFTMEVFVCPAGPPRGQRLKLAAMLGQRRALCCVLSSTSREVQEFFAAGALPALVLGSCHPGLKLPSLDVDYRSVCRHAATTLCRQGHRSLAFLVPDSSRAGDLASEAGFREGASDRSASDTALAIVSRHDGSQRDLSAKLDALFTAERPPTALVVARPQYTIDVILHFLQRGLKVPDDVSLIARDHDFLYEEGISHYAFKRETFAHRLTRLMLRMVEQGYLPAEASLIFPDFVPRGTVRAISPPAPG